VLNKNPNLKMLHRELVLGKQITEEEFWEGREVSDGVWWGCTRI
jgi:transcription initiation factor TFIIH subunit 1